MSRIISFLQKAFSSLFSSIHLPLTLISHNLVKVAKSNSYVETLGAHSDALHLWIKKSYEEDLQSSFEHEVRKALKHLGVSYARLAFDITTEPFYGRTRSLHIIDTNGESYGAEFKFMCVSLVTRNKQIPLMALPVRLGNQTAQVLDILKYCQTLFKGIRLALFDRGFYIGELIDYLEAHSIRYIILVPERGDVIKDYVAKTSELGIYSHEMRYTKEKSSWKPRTKIVVCKGIDDFAWIFATNIHFKTRVEYIWYYKRRWQIETNFRVDDEAHIKSKSTHYLIRYFYFLVSQLLRLLWVVNKNLRYYCPFKRYLDIVENELLLRYLELCGIT